MQRTVRPEAKDVAELVEPMLFGIYQYKVDWNIQMGNLPGGDGATACRDGHWRGRHSDLWWRPDSGAGDLGVVNSRGGWSYTSRAGCTRSRGGINRCCAQG